MECCFVSCTQGLEQILEIALEIPKNLVPALSDTTGRINEQILELYKLTEQAI